MDDMNIENGLPIILIVGGIGLYFLVSGIAALVKKRMTVVNPFAKKYPLTIFDAVMSILEKKVEDDNKVPERFVDRSPRMILKDKKVLARAWFHIIMGLIALIIMAIFLNPAILDKIMNLLI